MSFQKTVLTVAIVLFIILMLLIAVMMSSAKNNEVYPPQIGQCPDYWQLVAGGKCFKFPEFRKELYKSNGFFENGQ